MKRRLFIITAILTALLFLTTGIDSRQVRAEDDVRVMQAIVIEDVVKAYVRGTPVSEGATYQIGNIPAEDPKAYSISEDSYGMRTLIMIDNSLSIPQNSRPMLKEAVKAIIDAHGDNECFRIAVFSDRIDYLSDRYSDDYTVLKNVVDSIEHADQETYLTDVLYDVVDDLNTEKYPGYTRIIIFSDGVDNKPIGVTREELNKKLEDSSYPVYTIGAKTGKNDSEIENMFALSRLTGCEYLILEETDASGVADVTRRDADITVFETSIPEDAKIGGKQSSKLTFSDGNFVVFNVDMPFGIKEKEESVIESPTEEDTVETPTESEEQVEKPIEQNYLSGLSIKLIIVAAAIVLIVFLIVFLSKNRRKKSKNKNNDSQQPDQQPVSDYEKTEIIGATPSRSDRGTVLMTPDSAGNEEVRYRFTLTDAADAARSFRCELISEIKIGRQPDNNIVLSDDVSVHGHQATVSVNNGTFYYTDLKEVKNHSSVNGIQLKPGLPQLIVTNSRITIGRHTYVVSVSK